MLQTSFNSQGILIFRKTTGDKEGLRKSCQLIKGTDSKLVDMILNEVIPKGSTGVTWADVSGNKEYTSHLIFMKFGLKIKYSNFTMVIINLGVKNPDISF